MDPRLQELCDRAEILDCLQRYARGIDRLDRELVRSAYHDGAIDDHVGFVYHATQSRHQHYLMNHTAEIAGDEAHAETYYAFVGTDRDPGKPLIVSGGRYIDRFERRDGRWAIAARICLVEWQSDATSLLSPELVEFLDTVQTVARDTSDNSYDRPLVITRAAASP